MSYEAFELPADPRLTLSTHTAVPGTPSADALELLGMYAMTDADPAAAAL